MRVVAIETLNQTTSEQSQLLPDDVWFLHGGARIMKKINTSFGVKEGHYLVGNQGIYKVCKFLGEGSFGKVAKCTKLGSPGFCAIKIMKSDRAGLREMETMKRIKHLDPDKNHLVKMYECFSFQNMTCIVYEILEESLYNFFQKYEHHIHLCHIRVMAQQLLTALEAINSMGLIHCDIKMDNIMFIRQNCINVKLIDFGLALETKELTTVSRVQVTPFRAPEVILGLYPLDKSVDMWALGVVLASSYFGKYPFSYHTEYDTIRAMVQIFEHEQITANHVVKKSQTNLDEMIKIHRETFDQHDDDDHRVFIDLLKRMLEVNPQRRITPSQALTHDFLTLKHLSGESHAEYAAMKPAPQENLEKTEAPHTDSDQAKMPIGVKKRKKVFSVKKDILLIGNLGNYKVSDVLGEGSFGKVFKCHKEETEDIYAIKILKYVSDAKKEVEVMELIRDLDPDKNNLIKFYEYFTHRNVNCVVYEMLHQRLYDYMHKPTHLCNIRSVAEQMFQALSALKSIGVVHGDIKLDNILFADKNSLRMKLIDFGLARKAKELVKGTKIQVTPFRAPEVILGLPLDESIDMWALGMVLACLYSMVQIFGLPEEDLLTAGEFAGNFFTSDDGGNDPDMDDVCYHVVNLDTRIKVHQKTFDLHDDNDHRVFLDLLKRMLEVNPQKRIPPSQALAHDFITMRHLSGESAAEYFATAKTIMGSPSSSSSSNSSRTTNGNPQTPESKKLILWR
uniref:Protein kinase domain-containing protein n=1 Tax=Oryzias melastigma TaxID=30732 RepID=A0A3B3DSZ4_ORYME